MEPLRRELGGSPGGRCIRRASAAWMSGLPAPVHRTGFNGPPAAGRHALKYSPLDRSEIAPSDPFNVVRGHVARFHPAVDDVYIQAQVARAPGESLVVASRSPQDGDSSPLRSG